MLHRPQLCPLSATAAGGAAAFADVAAAGRAHLGAAGEAERSVRGAALLGLDQLGRAVRGRGSARKGRGRRRGLRLRRSEEHTSELQSRRDLVCRLLLEKKKENNIRINRIEVEHISLKR